MNLMVPTCQRNMKNENIPYMIPRKLDQRYDRNAILTGLLLLYQAVEGDEVFLLQVDHRVHKTLQSEQQMLILLTQQVSHPMNVL